MQTLVAFIEPVYGHAMNSPTTIAIVACEAGFWLLVAVGLAVRYYRGAGEVTPARERRSSLVLALVPLLDLALVVVVALDVHRGAEIGFAHRLAGVYLGVTVAFGHPIIAWADRRAAALARANVPPAQPAGLKKELRDFGRWLIAGAIALVVTAAIAWGLRHGPAPLPHSKVW